MSHLKRFKNWLGDVYYAYRALRQQFRASYRYLVGKRAAEEEHSATVYAASADAGPTLTAQPPVERSEAIGSSTAFGPGQVEPARFKMVMPAERAATPPGKTLHEATPAHKDCVVPIAEPKHAVTSVQKVSTVPQESVAAPFSAASSPKTQAPQALPENVNPQSTEDAASAPRSENGRYDPSKTNDQTAQRLARLLVSEIKLYYKSKTNGENRSELKNIYDMLKDPVDKSRQHYKQRMGATAFETMPDYFHAELVRSLCDGDPSRLGPNYQASDERT